MSGLVPFRFEEHEVLVLDENGSPLFPATKVCEILGYVNPRDAIARHVPTEDVVKRDTLTPGGQQLTNHVNESGLYALIFGSQLEAAKRFKRWVTSEVLPSIRKTGTYTAPVRRAPAHRPSEIYKLGQMIAKDLKRMGAADDVLEVMQLDLVRANTSVDIEPARKAIPGRQEVVWLNAKGVGAKIGVKAREANVLLERHGFQHKDEAGKWALGEKGKEHGELKAFTNNGHTGFQLEWKPSVVDALQKAIADALEKAS